LLPFEHISISFIADKRALACIVESDELFFCICEHFLSEIFNLIKMTGWLQGLNKVLAFGICLGFTIRMKSWVGFFGFGIDIFIEKKNNKIEIAVHETVSKLLHHIIFIIMIMIIISAQYASYLQVR